VALALCGLLGGAAQAQMLCSKPLQPLCSMEGQEFADAVAESRCRDDVRKYIQDLDAFQQCLVEAAEQARQDRKDAERLLSCLKDDPAGCPSLEADPAT
jgi:hypothetical protein